MPEEKPAEPPSRWTVINDYSKTVVTVCAALLAFIGAFSGKLLAGQLSVLAIWDVNITIGLLGLAALSALAVPGMLDRYLCVVAKELRQPPAEEKNLDSATQEEWDSRAKRIWNIKAVANLSYIFLASAVVGMAVFGICRPSQQANDGQSGSQTRMKDRDVAPPHALPRYEIAYSAIHRTNRGQQVHTFLLDKSKGEIWQMVCAPDGLVSFRRISRLNLNGNVEIPVDGKDPLVPAVP